MLTMDSISKAALSLEQPQRADLVVLIMDSLSPPAWGDSEILAEAERRDAEIESGEVSEMSHEEFISGLRIASAA
jgi:hypothetical protein